MYFKVAVRNFHVKFSASRWFPQMVVFTIVGASLSEPHTSESNGGFFIYICIYILLLYICRTHSVNAS